MFSSFTREQGQIFFKMRIAGKFLPLVRKINDAIKAPMSVMLERGTIATLDDIESSYFFL